MKTTIRSLVYLTLLTFCYALSAVAARAQITIMPLGDSITAGVDGGNTASSGGYRDPLFHDLTAAGISFTFVGLNNSSNELSSATRALIAANQSSHNGYGHYTISNIAANLNGVYQPVSSDGDQGGYWLTGGGGTGRGAVTPNIILLQAGTNDFLQSSSLQTAETNISNLVTEINSITPSTKIIVAGIPPFSLGTGSNPTIVQFNSYIQSMVNSSWSSYAKYVDNYHCFLNADGSVNTLLIGTADNVGVHPSRDGYAIMANNWAAAIESLEGSNPSTYTLTVTNGTADNGTSTGSYPAGTIVTVNSNAPAGGSQFAGWSSSSFATTRALTNPYNAITTFIMPAANVTVAANYAATGSPIIPNGTYDIVGGEDPFQMSWTGSPAGLSFATSGTSVQQQTYTGATNQQWVVTNLGSNVVSLIASGTTNALEPQGGTNTNGAVLDVTPYTGATTQQWTISPIYGTTEIVNVSTGYAVNDGYNGTSGAQLFQVTVGNAPADEAFVFYPISTGGGTTYALTVNSGTGSGSYAAGTTVTVTANTPPNGDQFAGWTGSTSGLANPSAATTTLTMPASATTITATYTPITTTYPLTVNNGTGGGNYTAGSVVTVTANAPTGGSTFAGWTGATSALANPAASTTILTMPASATTITATYSSPTGATGSIGVQFQGLGTALLASDSAGLSTVAQSNWNVINTSTFTGNALANNSGAGTTATLTGSANGGYYGGASSAAPAGNAKLTSGELFNTWPGAPTFTISGIPYSSYDVYIYAGIDAPGRYETVSLTPSGGAAQYFSFTTATGGSAWTAATSNWNGTGTAPSLPVANYVHYTALTSTSFTISWGAPNNGGMNGIQIVNTGSSGGGSAPSAPSNLSATPGSGQVSLSWTGGAGATSYSIYRGTTSGGETAVGTSTTTTFNDTSVSNGTNYYYRVAGVNSYGTSGYSNEVTATPNATTYALTVTNGSGSGSYAAGAVVTVTANTAPNGSQFAGWTGSTSYLANPAAGTTTLTMPAAAAAITATYSAIGNNLISDGTYKVVSQSSGLALATTGTTNGSSVVQLTYTGAAAQQWTLTNLGNNVVKMVSSGSTAALEDPGSSTTAGTLLDVSSYTGGTNQQWNIVAASSGYYEIVNVFSGLEVNVVQNSNVSGGTICQWTAGNYGNGVWSFNATSAPTTYALTVNSGTGSGNYAAGTVVTVTANTAPAGQQFSAWTGATSALASTTSATTTLTMPAAATSITANYTATGGGGSNLIGNGTYKLVSQSSSLALATTGTVNTSPVVQQTYTAAATQKWTLTNLGSNVVELVSSGSSEALEVPGSSTSAGTNLDISSYTGATNQQWTIIAASTGYYEVVNVNSGLEANVSGNSTSPGGVICQWFAGNYANGVWTFLAP
jgi:lysophospholipase L1-like esterase